MEKRRDASAKQQGLCLSRRRDDVYYAARPAKSWNCHHYTNEESDGQQLWHRYWTQRPCRASVCASNSPLHIPARNGVITRVGTRACAGGAVQQRLEPETRRSPSDNAAETGRTSLRHSPEMRNGSDALDPLMKRLPNLGCRWGEMASSRPGLQPDQGDVTCRCGRSAAGRKAAIRA